MFLLAIFVGSLKCATVLADVSHLAPAFNVFGGYENGDLTEFHGYHYDTPSLPFSTTTTQRPFLLPEIIVNKRIKSNKPSTVYLPPPSQIVPDTEPPLAVPPLSDDSNVYLPPAFDAEPPSSVYLPPPARPVDAIVIDRPSNVYVPPPPSVLQDKPIPETPVPSFPSKPSDDDEHPGYQYLAPTKATVVSVRNHKNIDLLRGQNGSNALRLGLSDLRCLQHRDGYFRANIVAQSFIETLPIVDADASSAQCQLRLIRTTFVLNIRSSDFERCGVHACSDNELCVKIRFPQIAGMKSANDALLTLQCKLQERVAAKTHALRFGIADIRWENCHSPFVALHSNWSSTLFVQVMAAVLALMLAAAFSNHFEHN